MTTAASQPDRFGTLLMTLAERELTDDERAELFAHLSKHPEDRDRYLDYATLHAALDWDQARTSTVPPVTVDPSPIPIYRKGHEPIPKSETRIPKFAIYSAIAAALLAACGLAIYLLAFSADPSDIEHRPSNIEHPPLANLIENASEGTLTTPGGFISEGRDYPRGEYALDKGTAEFMLTNSVNVKLRGETRMHMRGDMNVALTHGSASFVVPKDAKGFTVHLPGGSRVVDLGTAFVVHVDVNGRADVFVTEGSVRLESATGHTQTLAAGSGRGVVASGELTDVDVTAIATAIPGFDADGEAIEIGDASFEQVAVRELGNAHSPHWESNWEPGPLFDPSNNEFAGTTGGEADAGPGGSNTDGVLPDGGQVAFVYDGSHLWQTLATEVEPGETYRLRFFHGAWRKGDGEFARYRVQLLAGDAVIVETTSDQIDESAVPAPGEFAEIELTGRASLDAEGPLRIVFTSLDGQRLTFIDHVRLHRLHNPADAPDPTSQPPAPLGAQPQEQ